MRVPCIIRWPEKIPAGSTCREMVTATDVLPALARLTGAKIPRDRIIDGHDISDLLFGKQGIHSPYTAFFFYRDDRLQAVRSGRWKLHVYRPEWDEESHRGPRKPLLFDLDRDLGETADLADQYPLVVEQLKALSEQARTDLGDTRTNRRGRNVRPVGQL